MGQQSSNQKNTQHLPQGHGYRVIGVESGSYAEQLSMYIFHQDFEAFLDFIVEIADSQSIESLQSDVPLHLTVFNIRDQIKRPIYINKPRSEIQLGLMIRLEPIESVILHITKVLDNSPADIAGIVVNDYLIGIVSHTYNSINKFSEIVADTVKNSGSLVLCLFNQNWSRLITIKPQEWQGPGLLGCEFAQGALHYLPKLEAAPQEQEFKQEQTQDAQILEHPQQQQEILEQQILNNDTQTEIIQASPVINEEKEQKEVINFKGILRFQEPEVQENKEQEILLKEELNQSQTLEGVSQDYSHIQADSNLSAIIQSQVLEQTINQSIPELKSRDTLKFRSPKRELPYSVDRSLLFPNDFIN